jgi:putative ATP-dependent endonuclease of OLD family
MESSLGDAYTHVDLAGVSIFNAGSDGAVPQFGPFFKALGKVSFALYDKQKTPFSEEATKKLAFYTKFWELPEKGIENVLVKETSIAILKRFLETTNTRADYPAVGTINDAMKEDEIRGLAREVLKARKGEGYPYAALLISECTTATELPATIRMILETINTELQEKCPIEPVDSLKGKDGVVEEDIVTIPEL